MNTFNYYQQIKKSALKVLIGAGVNVREAITMLRLNMPYLFSGKSKLDEIDRDKYPA